MFNHKMVTLPKLQQLNLPEGRRYETDDHRRFPSITTVLGDTADKSHFFEWRKRVGEEKANAISRAAASRGTSMHKLCERYLLNEDVMAEMPHDDEFADITEGDWTAGQLMFRHIKPALDRMDNIRVLEGRLFSKALGVAGTVDCIAEIDGKLSVIDFKTSRRMKYKDGIEDYFLQGCFYFSAYYEMTGELPKQVAILISVQDGTLCEYVINGRELIEYTEKLKKRIRQWHYKNKVPVPEGAKACY